MIKIACIDHIVLRTTNISTMVDFYTQILGCTIERETPTETGLTQLRAGSALIDLVTVDSKLGRLGGGPPTKTENNVDHFCLQIEPLAQEDVISHLNQHGISTGAFDERYGAQGFGDSIYIQDPDGNTVELRNRTEIG